VERELVRNLATGSNEAVSSSTTNPISSSPQKSTALAEKGIELRARAGANNINSNLCVDDAQL